MVTLIDWLVDREAAPECDTYMLEYEREIPEKLLVRGGLWGVVYG